MRNRYKTCLKAVIPAYLGIQLAVFIKWIPAFAVMTRKGVLFLALAILTSTASTPSQAYALNCITASSDASARATGLITVGSQADNKFSSTEGACVIDPRANFLPKGYANWKSQFYGQSKISSSQSVIQAAPQTNSVANPSFENPNPATNTMSSIPASWNVFGSTRSLDQGGVGGTCWAIKVPAGTSSTQDVTLPNTSGDYVFSASVYSDSAGKASVQVSGAGSCGGSAAPTNFWSAVNCTFSKTTASSTVTITLFNGPGASTVYFDDVKIVPASSAKIATSATTKFSSTKATSSGCSSTGCTQSYFNSPDGQIVTDSIYNISGDLDIYSPGITSTSAHTIVVFVDGNLNFHTNYTYGDSSHGSVFIVGGKINIDEGVTRVDAILLSNQEVCSSYHFATAISSAAEGCNPTNTLSSQPLIINGSVGLCLDTANHPNCPSYPQFVRSLSNNSVAAEQIIFQPKYYGALKDLLSTAYTSYSEITDPSYIPPQAGQPLPTTSSSSGGTSTGGTTGGTGTTAATVTPVYPTNNELQVCGNRSTDPYGTIHHDQGCSIDGPADSRKDYFPGNQCTSLKCGYPQATYTDSTGAANCSGVPADSPNDTGSYCHTAKQGYNGASCFSQSQTCAAVGVPQNNFNSMCLTCNPADTTTNSKRYYPGNSCTSKQCPLPPSNQATQCNSSCTPTPNIYYDGNSCTQRACSNNYPTSTAASCPTSCQTILPKAAGYWRFNESLGTSAQDQSGNSNTGTLINGPTWTSGKVGNGLLFNGINQYVRVPNNPTIQPSNALTVGGWFYVKSLNNIAGSFISKRGDYILHPNTDGSLNFYVSISSSWYSVGVAANTIALNTWQHWVGVYDGSSIKIYLNGILQSSAAVSGALDTFGDLLIGSDVDCNCGIRYLNGLADEVVVYPTALTSSDITTLYNGGTPGQYFDGSSCGLKNCFNNFPSATYSSCSSLPDDNPTDIAGCHSAYTGYSGQSCDATSMSCPNTYPAGNQPTVCGPDNTTACVNGVRQKYWTGNSCVKATCDFPYAPYGQHDRVCGSRVGSNDSDGCTVLGGSLKTYYPGNSCSPTTCFPNPSITCPTNSCHGDIYGFGGTDCANYLVCPSNASTYASTQSQSAVCGSNNTTACDNSALEAYWSFNEGSGSSAYDSTDRGHNGILSGSPTWTAGKYANGLQFGIYQFVDAGNSGNLAYNTSRGGLSAAAWVKVPAGHNYVYATVFGGWNSLNWDVYAGSNADNGRARLEIQGCSPVALIGGPDIRDNQWHHVAASATLSGRKLYVDGNLVASDGCVGSAGNGTGAHLQIGASNHAPEFFPGVIDEPMIWTKELTQANIQQVMNTYDNKFGFLQTYYGTSCSTGTCGYPYSPGGSCYNFSPDCPGNACTTAPGRCYLGNSCAKSGYCPNNYYQAATCSTACFPIGTTPNPQYAYSGSSCTGTECPANRTAEYICPTTYDASQADCNTRIKHSVSNGNCGTKDCWGTINCPVGRGSDGDCNIAAGTAVGLWADSCSGRAYPDGKYVILGSFNLGWANGANAGDSSIHIYDIFNNSAHGLSSGDEIYLYQINGYSSPFPGPHHETVTIESILMTDTQNGIIYLNKPLTYSYPAGRTSVYRVPNYRNVNISGSMYGAGFMLFLRASGTVTVNSGGLVSVQAAAYSGGSATHAGDGYFGSGNSTPACSSNGNGGNGSGTDSFSNVCSSGGGVGATASTLFTAGGGGGGGFDSGVYGGNGGGVLIMQTANLINNGVISAAGAIGANCTGASGGCYNGSSGGGGGGGGFALLNIQQGGTFVHGTVNVSGGSGGQPITQCVAFDQFGQCLGYNTIGAYGGVGGRGCDFDGVGCRP